MINKVYSKVISFIKNNFLFFLFLILFYVIINIPLPYYIHTTGGLINISDKVKIEHEKVKKGSFNLAYVTEIRGNILTCLLSYVVPNWDLINANEVSFNNETYEDVDFRNKVLLNEANQNAIFLAYQTAHKYINLTDPVNYVVFVDPKADTNLKIGDQVLEMDNQVITDLSSYSQIVNNHNLGDILTLKVKDKNNKLKDRKIKVYEYKSKKITGTYFITLYKYVTDPKIDLHFKETESGPSGGLMMSLSIYNKLIDEDITKGHKIVGTGTIDINGNVGEISGVEYKLKGAVKEHADVFLAPAGKNYKDAMALKKKNHYKIEIIGVSTFTDALNYLKSL